MKKIKGIVAMLIAMVVLLTTGGTRVYADDTADWTEVSQKIEESLPEEYKKAYDEYYSKNLLDCNEMYNATREFYTNWGKEIAYYELKFYEMVGEHLSTEEIESIKEYYTWYETEEDLRAHPLSRASQWVRMVIRCVNADANGKVMFGVYTEGDNVPVLYEATFEKGKETVVNIPLVQGVMFVQSLDIYFADQNGEHYKREDGDLVRMYISETSLDGEKHTVSYDSPIHLDRKDLDDFSKVHTLEFAFNGKLTEEQIAENAKTITFDESTELAKEEGFIKEVAPVEKKETVNLDEVIKAITEEDTTPVEAGDKAGETSGKTFPVLPVVIGAIVCLIGAVAFIIIKRRKK